VISSIIELALTLGGLSLEGRLKLLELVFFLGVFLEGLRIVLEEPVAFRDGAVVVVEVADARHLVEILHLALFLKHFLECLCITSHVIKLRCEDDAWREFFYRFNHATDGIQV
jgi:hypothetical protein